MDNEFPTTIVEFNECFSTEEACAAYLESVRWPGGFVCPKCRGQEAWRMKSRPVLHCKACGRQTSITAGTPFHGTRKPLRAWFQAMFLMSTQKTGTSAANLQRQIGLGSYETAWTWLHKLRGGMRLFTRRKLKGCVEADEGFIGGDETGVVGRQINEKALVAVAAEDLGGRIGRVRLQVEPDASQRTLNAFFAANIEPGSFARTDAWSGYAELKRAGFSHQAINVKKSGKTASELLPRVHLVLSLLKRWLLGTFQGAVSSKHLQAYLDEFTFRFNRRTCRFATGVFERLATAVMAAPPRSRVAIINRVPLPRAA
jgi:transposase-like protein